MLLRGFLGLVCAAAFAVAPAYAQSPFQFSDVPDQSGPALIAADQMTYASDGETITAIGDVTIVQGARALSADQVTYEVAADRIIATGSVTLIEPGGETLNANRVERRSEVVAAAAAGETAERSAFLFLMSRGTIKYGVHKSQSVRWASPFGTGMFMSQF